MENVPNNTSPNDAAHGGLREPAISREVAFERVDRDPELLKEIVALMLEDLPRLMDNIHASIDQDDMPSLEHWAHTLKGSVGNFGAEKSWDMACELEKLARDPDPTTIACTHRRLKAEVVDVMAALRDLAREEQI